jgi:hypothetical protein
MSDQKCSYSIYNNHQYYPCAARATTEHNGKGYCRQHNPGEIMRKEEAKSERIRRAYEMAMLQDQIEAAKKTVILAARALAHCGGSAEAVAFSVTQLEELEAQKDAV